MKFYLSLFLVCFSTLSAKNTLTPLTAEKAAIVDEKGHAFTVKGVNLGGWFEEEMWMLPFVQTPPKGSHAEPIQDSVSLWQVFEKRFGTKKMNEIRTAFRKTWLNNADFATIKATGFNAVRLPFLCDLYDEPQGLLFWLDHAVELAKKNGLYVLLDMHGAPGRQGKSQTTGQMNVNEFFTHPSDIKKASKIWKKIAKHYKHETHILGYDLLNEPRGTKSQKELYKVYNEFYKAIRSVDSKHLIFFEDDYQKIVDFPLYKDYKWKNVVLSSHFYMFEPHTKEEYIDAFNTRIKDLEEKLAKSDIPYYLGEFNVAPHGDFDTLKQTTSILHKKKISYSFWTYKVGRTNDQDPFWGLYFAPDTQKDIDPYQDSFKDVLEKIKRRDSRNYKTNTSIDNLFKG